MPQLKIRKLATFLILSFIVPGLAAEPGRVELRGHVPAAMAHLMSQGRLPATNELRLSICLPLRNQEALTNLLRELYDPASPNYHHYLTSAQFAEQFGPAESRSEEGRV